MKRPKKEDYMNKDPQLKELFDGEILDFVEYAVANSKYIDYLEAKIKDYESNIKKD